MPTSSKRTARLGLETLEAREVPATLAAAPPDVANGTAYGERAVARADNGNTVVVWEGSNYGDPFYARLYNSSGVALTGAIKINSTGAGDYDPAVAIAGNGRSFVVAWDHTYSPNDLDVRAQVFDASGNPVGGTIWVAASTHNEQGASVAMDYSGNFAVAYSYAYSPTDSDVYVRQFNSSGSYLRTVPVATSGYSEFNPSIDMNASGQFVVAYEYQYTSTDRNVFASSFNASGGLLTHVAIATSSMSEDEPSAAIDTSGNYLVAYTIESSPMSEVRVRRISSTGAWRGGLIEVGYSLHPESNPSVDMAGDGRFVVAYESEWGPGDTDIVAQEYDSAGSAVGGAFYVAGSSNEEYMPSVGMDSSGNFTVVYNTQNYSNTYWPVVARMYSW